MEKNDLAFLLNIISVNLLSFSLYASFDEAFSGGLFNPFVYWSLSASIICLVVTMRLLDLSKYSAEDSARWLVGMLAEIGIALLPAGLSALNSGNVKVGVFLTVLAVLSALMFIKYVSIFKRFFFD